MTEDANAFDREKPPADSIKLVYELKWKRIIFGSRFAFGLLISFCSIISILYFFNDETANIWVLGPSLLIFGILTCIVARIRYSEDKRINPPIKFLKISNALLWLCFVVTAYGVLVVVDMDDKDTWLLIGIGIGIVLYIFPFLFKYIRLPAHTRKELVKVGGVLTLAVTILLSGGASYYLATEIWAPRPLYLRTIHDPIVEDYVFNSNYGDLQATLEEIYPWELPDPTNPDNYAWGESYHLRTLVHFANATVNSTLFIEAIERIEMVMDHGYEGGGSEPGFGSDDYDRDPITGEFIWVNYDVHDGVICLPIAECARIVLNSSGALHTAMAGYTVNATRMLDFCERIIQKWDRLTWEEGDGIFGRWGNYPSVPSNNTIYNRFTALGLLCVELYYITGNATYRDKAFMMARTLKAGMEKVNYWMDGALQTMYTWPYSYSEPKGLWRYGGAEDVSHGSIELEFAIKCYYLGGVFTETDMTYLSNTFMDVVFKGLNAFPIFSNNVDGSFPDWYEGMTSYSQINTYASSNSETLYFIILRQSWVMLVDYYRDPAWASYIATKSFEILVDAGYASVGIIGCVLHLLEVENEFPWVM